MESAEHYFPPQKPHAREPRAYLRKSMNGILSKFLSFQSSVSSAVKGRNDYIV